MSWRTHYRYCRFLLAKVPQISFINPNGRRMFSLKTPVVKNPLHITCRAQHCLERPRFQCYHDTRKTFSKDEKNKPTESHLHHPKVVEKLARIEDSLRFHGYSTLRVGAFIIAFTGLGMYIFREHIRENVADEVTTVASRSLGDESVKLKAQELAKALLNAILSDPQMQDQAVQFLQSTFSNPDTKAAVVQLLANVLSDPSAQAQLVKTLKYVMNMALGDPQFRAYLAENLKFVLQDDNTKQALLLLLQYALNDDTVKFHAQQFLQDIVASEMVRQEAVKLGRTVVDGVVTDTDVQKKTGDGLWAAFTHSLTPSWIGGRSQADQSKNNAKAVDAQVKDANVDAKTDQGA